MEQFIPLSIPNFEGNEREYVDDAIDQGWVSTGGTYVNKLEKELAKFLHVDDIVACQSGTSGIHLALVDAGIGQGDIIIVPTLTFIAAVNPVKYQSAEPVFMDCDDSLCIDPVKIRKFCERECEFEDNKLVHRTSRGHVKALIVVHVFGNLADMESIMQIADKYKIKVIEDATEALGTLYTDGVYAGKYAGTIGDYGVYSFNGNKIITTGGGGAVTAKDVRCVRHIRYLSTQAKDDSLYYIHNEIGYNYRITNVQAAIGVAQMEELPEFIKRKQRNYELYKELFANFPIGEILGFRVGTSSNKWFYSLRIDRSKIHASLREIITIIEKRGIQTRAIWELVHEQVPYKNSMIYQIEKAYAYKESVLNLPSSTQITEEEIRYVTEQIMIILKRFVDG